ncbi:MULTISPECIES: hypothetical protein [unclassified Nostoc]|uniref:hypothetical protein n=1 Tax=unclassified Nostoc TaxID=2593658 RepID=UPI0025F3687E|nr:MULTISPECIES: hypothetical protein [unclassified Nostoc]
MAALGRKVSPKTPSLMPVGSLYLQLGEERRRSGSHYTPRALTEPIVKETLASGGLGHSSQSSPD